MTITYSKEVATSNFSCFLKLLARWKGSIYKLLWKDFILFALIYFVLSFIYRFALNDYQRKVFEMISLYCEGNNARIPVAFILGFYVSLIMTRWWNQLALIPWPDHMAMFVTANVQGADERGRMMRRTMVRYVCLAFTLTMSCISPAVRKRFPTNDHIVQAGIMTENEKNILEKIPDKYGIFFIPLCWITTLVNRARRENRVKDDMALRTLVGEINEVRRCLATLMVYDWISVPLVYTQVVTWAVYMFFLASLMGKQFLAGKQDMYFPLFTFLEYFFYMGWLKVAECLVNPFGEDEDDFDVNFLIDRNLCVAYTIVDDVHKEQPEMIKDIYWDEQDFEMPYTKASEPFRVQFPHKGSAIDLAVSQKDKEMFKVTSMEPIWEDDKEEEESSLLRQNSNRKRISKQRSEISYSAQESDIFDKSKKDTEEGSTKKMEGSTEDLQFDIDIDEQQKNKGKSIPMRQMKSQISKSYQPEFRRSKGFQTSPANTRQRDIIVDMNQPGITKDQSTSTTEIPCSPTIVESPIWEIAPSQWIQPAGPRST